MATRLARTSRVVGATGVLALAAVMFAVASGAQEHREGDFLFELRTQDLFETYSVSNAG